MNTRTRNTYIIYIQYYEEKILPSYIHIQDISLNNGIMNEGPDQITGIFMDTRNLIKKI